jgi:hypothetical protein
MIRARVGLNSVVEDMGEGKEEDKTNQLFGSDL